MSKSSIRKSGGARQVTKDPKVKYAPYFKRKAVYFTENEKYAYINMMRFELDAPTVLRGENILVDMVSLRKMFAPEMQAVITASSAEITMDGKTIRIKAGEMTANLNGIDFELEVPAETIEGRFYVDPETLMGKGFGKAVRWERSYLAPGDFLGIAEKQEDMFEERQVGKDLLIYLHKKNGVLRRAYYFEEADTIQPYLVYIPFEYDPNKTYKLTMVLHGAGGGVGDSRDLMWKPTFLETCAQERDMILLFPEGYGMGFYGGGSPELKPELCGEEELPYLKLCQHEPMCALQKVLDEFNIDKDNIFITGNSMGGAGTFWLTMQYPDVFKACAIGGAMTTDDLSYFDLKCIEGKRLLMVCGTENIGFDNVPAQVKHFNEHGVIASYNGIAGGVHGDAWVYAFDKTLDFFLQS